MSDRPPQNLAEAIASGVDVSRFLERYWQQHGDMMFDDLADLISTASTQRKLGVVDGWLNKLEQAYSERWKS